MNQPTVQQGRGLSKVEIVALSVVAGIVALALVGLVVALNMPKGTPTVLAVPNPPAAVVEQPAVPAGIGAGTYLVGVDLEPGTYRTAGPSTGGSCYWARLSNNGGGFDAVIANALSKGPTVVAIAPGDVAFRTNSCAPWVRIG